MESRTNQSQLNGYLEAFGERTEDRMFYVFHSVTGQLACNDSTVSLIGPDALAPMVLDAGLINWVLERAG